MPAIEQTSSNRPRILVLGATGYIGRNVLRALDGQPELHVIAGCRNPAQLQMRPASGDVRVGDLRDRRYLQSVFDGVDVVCFAAAWSALHGHADASRRNFLEPTLAAMTYAAAAGVKRMLFTSAIDVANVEHSVHPRIRSRIDAVWPHLANVIRIEAHLRTLASQGVTAIPIRCGYFVGPESTLGILPVLLPRLRANVVPFIDHGRVRMRLADGRDVGEAFRVAAMAPGLTGFTSFDVVAEDPPTFRELLHLLHGEFGYPMPRFSVSYRLAYRFAWFTEMLSRVTPFEPLLTRSIVFLSEPARVDTGPLRALGFRPRHRWQDSVRAQVLSIQANRVPSRLTDAPPIPVLPA